MDLTPTTITVPLGSMQVLRAFASKLPSNHRYNLSKWLSIDFETRYSGWLYTVQKSSVLGNFRSARPGEYLKPPIEVFRYMRHFHGWKSRNDPMNIRVPVTITHRGYTYSGILQFHLKLTVYELNNKIN